MNLTAELKENFHRDRVLIFIFFSLLSLLSWFAMFLPDVLNPHNTCSLCHVKSAAAFNWNQFIMLFVMWSIMMVAMMIPSALPMILTFAMVNRRRKENGNPFVPTGLFVLGYLLTWIAFSAVAGGMQWYFHYQTWLSEDMVSRSRWLNAVILLLAGIFQFTPLKNNCLNLCRSPMGFIMTSWREGVRGAVIMGLHHGLFCLGCCWALMLLLFVLGVMNFGWVIVLSVVVLLEKVLPARLQLSRILGMVLILWGVVSIFIKFI